MDEQQQPGGAPARCRWAARAITLARDASLLLVVPSKRLTATDHVDAGSTAAALEWELAGDRVAASDSADPGSGEEEVRAGPQGA
jgi:hypothetical protein